MGRPGATTRAILAMQQHYGRVSPNSRIKYGVPRIQRRCVRVSKAVSSMVLPPLPLGDRLTRRFNRHSNNQLLDSFNGVLGLQNHCLKLILEFFLVILEVRVAGDEDIALSHNVAE